MTWFKVDDGLHSHPKWLAASTAARALWVSAGSWAAAHLTNGHVPRHALTALGARPRDAAELARLDLWEENGDGWRFHDWELYQPTAEAVEAERAAARERQQRAREKARESRRDARSDNDVSHGPPRHGPPDPTRPTEEPSSSDGLTTQPDTPTDDDQGSSLGQRVSAALSVLANRDLDARQTAPGLTPIANTVTWTNAAYTQRQERHGAELQTLASTHPDLDATQLAELADPIPAPVDNTTATVYDEQQRAERQRAEQHMTALAAQNTRPTETTGEGPRNARRALRQPPNESETS